jgi:septal ring factor EnvC (AmiA/AmiB activator)
MFIAKTNIIKRVSLIVTACVLSLTLSIGQAGAATVSELQDKSSQLQSEIDKNEATIEALGSEINTLEGKVAQLNAEISQASAEIQLTEVKLDELSQRLTAAEAELERQKGLLRASLRALYTRRDASTVELLIASDSFSDFINEQEYLERLQSAVKDSAEVVIALKQQIQVEQTQQEELLSKQEQQKNVLAEKRQEQQSILIKTEGEEAKFQAVLSSQVEELAKAETALIAALAALSSGSFKTAPIGPVTAGTVIGTVGNSGLSTGAHLHLEVRVNGRVTNPNPYIRNQPVDPVYISQIYGNSDPIYLSGYHPGIDYYPGSGAIYAIDAGSLYRGCSNDLLGTSNNPYGYVAIVQHVGGHFSVYAHMAGGPPECSYNTYY